MWEELLLAIPHTGDSDDARHRWVRIVFATEFMLVTAFLALAHGLLGMDWAADAWAPIAAVTGGVFGVVGCALALSSDLSTRRYRAVR